MTRRMSCSHCNGPLPPNALAKQRFCSRACVAAAKSERAASNFWNRIERGPDDACWVWRGALVSTGYGQTRWYGRQVPAHRVAYELVKGPIPDGHLIRHTCDNPPCCNPAHLLPGTPLDNARDRTERGRHQSATQTHCKHGHPLSGDNLYVRPSGRNRGCRTCRRDAKRRYEAKGKESQ